VKGELTVASIVLVLAIMLIRKCSKRRRQRRLGDRILSISSDIGNAPYPFDAKAYDDDIESRYPTMPKGVGFGSPPRLAPVVGIASSFPSQFETEVQGRFDNTIRGEYTKTTRAGPIHDRPDTFTCAMYPAGSCPIEHEISTNIPIVVERGSPVPSFNTGRMDHQPIVITTHQDHGRSSSSSSSSGKLLTPPQPLHQPRYKSKHIPAPLMISPSINEGTNSVRGFTPRKSTISVGSAYTGI
jgi:hypothetical protein